MRKEITIIIDLKKTDNYQKHYKIKGNPTMFLT